MPFDILIGETYMGLYARGGGVFENRVFEELDKEVMFADVVEGS